MDDEKCKCDHCSQMLGFGIEIYNGDCLAVMPGITAGSVDLILTDLPYGTTNAKWDTPINLGLLWQSYRRLIKPHGAILLFSQTPFDKYLGYSNIVWLRYEIIWEKTEATGHLNAKKMPMKAHENILVFYEKLPTYNPQKTTGHIRKTAKLVDRATKQSELYGKQKGITSYDSTERFPRSVVKFSTDKQKHIYHPTQKPLALLEWLIKTYSNPGDIVLDSCVGSGSTLVACKNLGRKGIGIELSQKYCEIAKKRVLGK